MDYRRREPRFEVNQHVTVTNLEKPGCVLPGKLANFSAKGIQLILEENLQPGAMVKVEWGGTILLGEIMYCARQGLQYAAGLELEDALYDTETLAIMAESGSAPHPGMRHDPTVASSARKPG